MPIKVDRCPCSQYWSKSLLLILIHRCYGYGGLFCEFDEMDVESVDGRPEIISWLEMVVNDSDDNGGRKKETDCLRTTRQMADLIKGHRNIRQIASSPESTGLEPSLTIMSCSGLNLTGADTGVIHDMDFNPQIGRQAEDCCHRIGQTKPGSRSSGCEDNIAMSPTQKLAVKSARRSRSHHCVIPFHRTRSWACETGSAHTGLAGPTACTLCLLSTFHALRTARLPNTQTSLRDQSISHVSDVGIVFLTLASIIFAYCSKLEVDVAGKEPLDKEV
ncbi:hypothetical protein Fmac_001912 [Flemingia macrophylla]|uniref:Helicase C-terminal domain-containing protein n=1 Tax=Flemingia macrophylla TaxID=520843 RepID=A0ABD1NJT0_9FABA